MQILQKVKYMKELLKRYNIHNTEDLYAAIGIGQLSASSFISKLKEENIIDKQSQENLNKPIEEQYNKFDKGTENK